MVGGPFAPSGKPQLTQQNLGTFLRIVLHETENTFPQRGQSNLNISSSETASRTVSEPKMARKRNRCRGFVKTATMFNAAIRNPMGMRE
jgi:hypothetical protein